MAFKKQTRLNGICPYFTMFPLEFPFDILNKYASTDQWVIDPFCGRGTTNYAGRILGLPSIGIDSSKVAVALSEAKLANTTPDQIVNEAQKILQDVLDVQEVPQGEFWDWAYHKEVLHNLCKLREQLTEDCITDARKALRAIILGGLHGPLGKTMQSYFSNQSQRTYAPKPKYAVRYWKKHDLKPKYVDVLEIIRLRAVRYYQHEETTANGWIMQGDSRDTGLFSGIDQQIDWVITSPPYYGMRTYLPDQWIRMWFLGGLADVDYTNEAQLEHNSVEFFIEQLRRVWLNIELIAKPGAKMIIRFGSINDRVVDPVFLVKQTLQDTNWKLDTLVTAGTADNGKRQAKHILRNGKNAREEYDFWATLAS